MKIKDYLIDYIPSIIIYCITSLVSGALLWLIEIQLQFIFLIELLWSIAFWGNLLWDFFRKKQYYQKLWSLFDCLDNKTLLSELLDVPTFLEGKMIYQIISHTDKFMADQIAQADATNREYREYIEMWIHEIKTPITSAHLIAENEKNRTTIRIDDELRKIEHYVEQALYYAKSTALEKDFKPETITLKELIHRALKSYSKQMIQAGGVPEFENLDIEVLADKKWCSFVIGQLIANSIKYKKDKLRLIFRGGIDENGCYLIVSDFGIGISQTDLSRIFEKGFTGENGRKYTKSTGIGLYLCRKLCQKMNMDISAESVQGNGTSIKLIFPKSSFYFEKM